MSKKMKGVALESSINGSFKHQSLIQDYQEIKKETEVAINKLEVMKQRKLTLLAEVRFLRQRHKHLLETKATNPQQTRHKSVTMENNGSKKKKNLQSKAPTLDLKMKKISSKFKESYINQREKNNLGFGSNQKERKNCSKEATFKHPSEVLHWNKKESFSLGMELNSQKKDLGFDLNLMEKSYAVRKESVQNRALAFDLNLELAEEDLQENNESSRSEEPDNFFSVANEEQSNDLKLSICRNVENVPNHSGKRKISWQDPMALKV